MVYFNLDSKTKFKNKIKILLQSKRNYQKNLQIRNNFLYLFQFVV